MKVMIYLWSSNLNNKKSKLEKLILKTKLNEDQIKNIIYYNHLIEKLFTKTEIKKINLNFNLKSLKMIKKIAKLLKVSDDAVINAALDIYLESKELT